MTEIEILGHIFCSDLELKVKVTCRLPVKRSPRDKNYWRSFSALLPSQSYLTSCGSSSDDKELPSSIILDSSFLPPSASSLSRSFLSPPFFRTHFFRIPSCRPPSFMPLFTFFLTPYQTFHPSSNRWLSFLFPIYSSLIPFALLTFTLLPYAIPILSPIFL